jgi:hypothetical protein
VGPTGAGGHRRLTQVAEPPTNPLRVIRQLPFLRIVGLGAEAEGCSEYGAEELVFAGIAIVDGMRLAVTIYD